MYRIDERGITAKRMRSARPYDKNDVSPLTAAHVALLCACSRMTLRRTEALYAKVKGDARRELFDILDAERRRYDMSALLTPGDSDAQERAITHEMLAIELAASFAKRETDKSVKAALEYTIADDMDHLYRFSNLVDLDRGISAQTAIGGMCEVMPARHTATQAAALKERMRNPPSSPRTANTTLAVLAIGAVKHATFDLYTLSGSLAKDRLSRALFSEIARVEHMHALSVADAEKLPSDPFKLALLQKYCESYLLFSCAAAEPNARFREIFERSLSESANGFARISELAEKCGKKDCEKTVADGKFPPPLALCGNDAYIRNVLENILSVADNGDAHDLYLKNSPSHAVVVEHIRRLGRDYRYGSAPHPLPRLRKTTEDNV